MADRGRDSALSDAMGRVVWPVVFCMALSIWLVKSVNDPKSCNRITTAVAKPPFLDIFPEKQTPRPAVPKGPVMFRTRETLIFVGIFCVLIVLCTFLLVWLFKNGHQRFIAGWLIVAVAIIFAYVGGIYLFEFCRSRCINLDWITLSFAVWNFAITGLVSIFWTVPRVINQAYLIVMSSLMAFIFRTLPSWSTWTILGVLVAWDLFAVLAPWGPLRKLVEAARTQDEPLPALVYDTNPNDIGRDPEAKPAVVFKRTKKERRNAASTRSGPTTEPEQSGEEGTPATSATPEELAEKEARRAARRRAKKARERAASAENGTDAQSSPRQQEETRVGTLGTHLKLGLGDFVFYSVLVAEASKGGAMTAIISFVAILAGLCATLFLVIVYKKALPALPISIVTGMLFYVLTRWTVKPFVLNLLPELLFH